MSYIEFKNVCKDYKMGEVIIHALSNANLSIEKGELVVIVGPSGAGKTTALNILGGMDNATSGRVIVDNKEISRLKNRDLIKYRREDIGFVFQFYNLVQNLTAIENVELATQICKKSLNPEQVMEKVGLAERKNNFPSQLSGGEQQRVAIARAMLRNAPIVILDEATSALDNESEAIVQKAMDNLMKDRTVFIIAHRLSTIKNADRIAVINEGELVELGSNEELMQIENGQYKALYEMQFKKQEV